MEKPFAVWIDFDGTLVEPNVAMVLVERFGENGKAAAREVDEQLHAGLITLRQAWEREVAILPPDRLGEMAEYAVEHSPLRAGARELIDLLDRHHVRATVISGGVDFYIGPVLEREGIRWPWLSDRLIRTPSGALGVEHPHGHPTCRLCGICKAQAVRGAGSERSTSVFIGDGSTDKYAAEVADIVFARRRLLSYCRERGIPHVPFEDFHPVRAWFADRLEGAGRPSDPRGTPGFSDSACPISQALASGHRAPTTPSRPLR
jgi:2-hydroxy-3-keto-5-methylthiopentenyl-1-phosphate phosphatase